jgi:hypothetical protein
MRLLVVYTRCHLERNEYENFQKFSVDVKIKLFIAMYIKIRHWSHELI